MPDATAYPSGIVKHFSAAACPDFIRIQFERQNTRPFPSVREYAHLYAMTGERLKRARKDLLILAPGPINRGVEVTADVADCQQSLILDQVANGLAVRMGALWLTCGPRIDTSDTVNRLSATQAS